MNRPIFIITLYIFIALLVADKDQFIDNKFKRLCRFDLRDDICLQQLFNNGPIDLLLALSLFVAEL